MGNMLVRNGRLIDPSQNIDQIADILIENGKVVKIEEKITDHVDRVLEARGLTVVPGLVDMHVHLRDPGFIIYSNVKFFASTIPITVSCSSTPDISGHTC